MFTITCLHCLHFTSVYTITYSSLSLKLTNGKTVSQTSKNYFSCDSKDVIFILNYKTCSNFYLEQTQDFKQIIAKYKSDAKNLHNNTCKICSERLRHCNQAKPYFQIFTFYYETNHVLR